MSADFEVAIVKVLDHEGGLVNDPVDPGGITNYGISLRYLASRGDLDHDGAFDGDINHDGVVDASDITSMTIEDAKELYRTGWWELYHYGELHQTVANKVLDCSVNMGSKRAHILAQRACNKLGWNLTEDGVLGPKSREMLNNCDPDRWLAAMRQCAADFYAGLIRQKPVFEKYRGGWMRRAMS